MAATRKLQTEIQQTLKKIEEGVELFDEIWEKVYAAETQALKEKFENELKKEIKKLQRLRDTVKTWLSSAEIKDKSALTEARRTIESKMELFKVCERDTKTKAYSKEGLARDSRVDPREQQKDETRSWLNEGLDQLRDLNALVEADKDKLLLSTGGGAKARNKNKEALERIENRLSKHKWHIVRIELMLRLLENDELEPTAIDAVRDSLEYYLETAAEDDGSVGVESEFDIYEELQLDQFGGFELKEREKDKEDDDKPTTSTAAAATASTAEKDGKDGKEKDGKEKEHKDGKEGKEKDKKDKENAKEKDVKGKKDKDKETAKEKDKETAASRKAEKASKSSAATSANTTAAAVVSGAHVVSGAQSHAPAVALPVSLPVSVSSVGSVTAPAVSVSVSSGSAPAVTVAPLVTPTQAATTAAAVAATQPTPPPAPLHTQTQAQAHTAAPLSVPSTQTQTQTVPPMPVSVPLSAPPALAPSFAAQPSVSVPAPVSVSAPSVGASVPAPPQPPMSAELQAVYAQLKQSYMFAPEVEPSTAYVPRNPYGGCHPSFPTAPVATTAADMSAIFDKLPLDTLFYAFYHQPQSTAQVLAARRLKKSSWRFHKKYSMWFQRHAEPKVSTAECEEGSFLYFDPESTGWNQRIKQDFKFEYAYLEDELPIS